VCRTVVVERQWWLHDAWAALPQVWRRCGCSGGELARGRWCDGAGARRKRRCVARADSGGVGARGLQTAARVQAAVARGRRCGGGAMRAAQGEDSASGRRTAANGGARRRRRRRVELETNGSKWVLSRQERNMTCGPRRISYRRLIRRLGFDHRLIASV
jgi:hypothetical protein